MPNPRGGRPAAPPVPARLLLGLAGAGLLAALLALAADAWPAALVVALSAAGLVAGLHRGLASILSGMLALLAAILAGPPLARALESPLTSALDLSGLTGRLVAIASAGLLVALVAGGLATIAARRLRRAREGFARADRVAGAAVGTLEGALAGALALWALTVLAPVAGGPLSAREDAAPSAPGVRAWLRDRAVEVRRSWAGRAAASLGPARESRLLALADAFVRVMNHDQAAAHLMASDVVSKIRALPSFAHARDRVLADPALRAALDADRFDAAALQTVFDSKTVLDLLDHSTVAHDLMPFADELERAVTDAAAIADATLPGSDGHPDFPPR